MKRLLAITVTTLAALVGCADGSEEKQEPAPTTEVSSEATPDGDETQAVQGWQIAASVVSSSVKKALESWEDTGCTAADFAMAEPDPACAAWLTAFATNTSTAVIEWEGRGKTASPNYIATKPSSVATYISSGDYEISALKLASDQVSSNCPGGAGCAGDILKLEVAAERAYTLFSGWPR